MAFTINSHVDTREVPCPEACGPNGCGRVHYEVVGTPRTTCSVHGPVEGYLHDHLWEQHAADLTEAGIDLTAIGG